MFQYYQHAIGLVQGGKYFTFWKNGAVQSISKFKKYKKYFSFFSILIGVGFGWAGWRSLEEKVQSEWVLNSRKNQQVSTQELEEWMQRMGFALNSDIKVDALEKPTRAKEQVSFPIIFFEKSFCFVAVQHDFDKIIQIYESLRPECSYFSSQKFNELSMNKLNSKTGNNALRDVLMEFIVQLNRELLDKKPEKKIKMKRENNTETYHKSKIKKRERDFREIVY